jgi:hypothetical protein
MKKKIFTLVLTLCLVCVTSVTFAQNISFVYDDAGNCTLKYKTVVLSSHAKKNVTDTLSTEPQTDMIGERQVIIYPNPTQGALKIEIKGELPKNPAQFFITDMNGRVIARQETSEPLYSYDMTSFPAGIYLLRVVIDGKPKEWKIVKE